MKRGILKVVGFQDAQLTTPIQLGSSAFSSPHDEQMRLPVRSKSSGHDLKKSKRNGDKKGKTKDTIDCLL